jgi:uncharacterized protein (TIGR00725 family)
LAAASGALVAVVGPGERDATLLDCEQAYEVGRLLAELRCSVLTGGLGGVMAEAARGARAADGLAVGVLPGADRADGNPHLIMSLPTGLGQLRNGVLVTAADAVLSVGCSWGTLSEIALAQRIGTPLACLRPWLLRDTDGREIPLPTASAPVDAVKMIAAALAR